MPDSDFLVGERITIAEIDQDSPFTESLAAKLKARDITVIELAKRATLFGGDGRDGAVNVTSNTNWSTLAPNNVLYCTTFNLAAGAILTDDTPLWPILIYASQSITASGTINADGAGGAGGAGGTDSTLGSPGTEGGTGGAGGSGGGAGQAGGAGAIGFGMDSISGSISGTSPTADGPAGKATPFWATGLLSSQANLSCNGGGGGGGGGSKRTGSSASAGGAGGGAIFLISPVITLEATAVLTAAGVNGQNGDQAGGGENAGGGGGGGGSIGILVKTGSYTDNGTTTSVAPGSSGTGNGTAGDGGAGSLGIITIEKV